MDILNILYYTTAKTIDRFVQIYNSLLHLKLPPITEEEIEAIILLILVIFFCGFIKILVNGSNRIYGKKQIIPAYIKEDFSLSVAISLVTGSAILGLLSGGSLAGGLVGEGLNSDDSNNS